MYPAAILPQIINRQNASAEYTNYFSQNGLKKYCLFLKTLRPPFPFPQHGPSDEGDAAEGFVEERGEGEDRCH